MHAQTSEEQQHRGVDQVHKHLWTEEARVGLVPALTLLVSLQPECKAEPRAGGHICPGCPDNKYSHWGGQEKVGQLLEFIVPQKTDIPVDILDVAVD